MRSKRNLISRIWSDYKSSFHSNEAIRESAPALTLLVIGTILTAIYIGHFLAIGKQNIGLTNVVVPTVFIVLAGLTSLLTFFSKPEHENKIAILQFMDVTFYASSMTAIAAFTTAPACYGFIGFYTVMCLRWASFYGLSWLGVTSISFVPSTVLLINSANIETIVLFIFGVVLFIYVSSTTKLKRKQKKRDDRILEILTNFDSLLARKDVSNFSDIQLYASSLVHKIKNELVPTSMFLSDLLLEPFVHNGLRININECINSIENSLKEIENYLEKIGTKNEALDVVNLETIRQSLVLRYDTDTRVIIADFGDSNIYIKQNHLLNALDNLIHNALETNATKVTVDSIDNGSIALINIKDNGPGLSDKVRESLFLPHNTAGKKHGIGLGIFLTHRIVLSYQGSLKLVKTSQFGTWFQIALKKQGQGKSKFE